MIFGAHVVLYSTDPEADRSFIADVFAFDAVDAGHGWLLFALPPAELAVHPGEYPGAGVLFMCDDLDAEIARLAARGATTGPVEQARWGRVTRVELPSGTTVGLYQPSHPTPLTPSASTTRRRPAPLKSDGSVSALVSEQRR